MAKKASPVARKSTSNEPEGKKTKKKSTSTEKKASKLKETEVGDAVPSNKGGVIKQGSIASFMRKRTQLVGFDFGHFKHVQYAVEFLDNALDAIETFHWKNQDPNLAYHLETENIFDDWASMEDEMMEATTQEAHGLSTDLSSVFSSMGDGNGDVSAFDGGISTPMAVEEVVEPVKKATKVQHKSDVDIKIQAIKEGMTDLITPYLNLVTSEPVIIIRMKEIEDESLVFIEETKNAKMYSFEIFDSGTGLAPTDLEKFGMYLASSKSEKLRQTRGSQGFGSPSAFSDAQNTTGKPIQVISKHFKYDKGFLSEFFTTGENTKSYTVAPTEVDLLFNHGTYIALNYTNIKYNRGYVDSYVKQTALMNSHVNIIFLDPYNETHVFKRLVNEFPDEPKYAKAHPSSINIGDFQDKLRTSEFSTIKQFLTMSFVRISDKIANNIIKNTEAELGDRFGLLMMKDYTYITFGKKTDDYVYLFRREKRVYGKSTKKRDKWVVYLLNIAKEDAIRDYLEIHRRYKGALSAIVKIDNKRKALEKKRDAAPTKKEAKEIEREIKGLEKEKLSYEKTKATIKKDFLTFTKDHEDAFEEILDEKVINVLEEKQGLVTLTRTNPKDLQELQVNTLYKYFTLEKYLAPPTDTAIPVGSDVMESVLIDEFNLNISKFDQYFPEVDGKVTLLNGEVEMPKTREELLKDRQEDLDEDSKLFSLLQLSEAEFTSRMATIPLLKFNKVARPVKNYMDLIAFGDDAYKHHDLFNQEIIEEDLDFVSATTRPPTSGKGLAFVVEAAIAYGKNVKTPSKASDVVYRFVNRTPKLRDNSDCAIWKTIAGVNWKNYMLETFDNGIPKGPIRVFVNVSGPFVHLMFKSQSKQALAEDENLTKEIKLSLEQVGRRLRLYLSRKQKHQDKKKRASRFIKFAPIISRSIFNILDRAGVPMEASSPEVLEDKLIETIGSKVSGPIESARLSSKILVAPPSSTKPAKVPAKGVVDGKGIVPGLKAPEKVPSTIIKRETVQKTLMSTPKRTETKTPAVKKIPGKPVRKKPPTKVPVKPAGPLKINEENILKYLPREKYVKISYLIKALGIKDITDARFLDMKLRILVKQGRVEKIKQDSKSHYKKKI
ncbi:MAG: hypothetical protein ACTSUE_22445 [Promethearchaeota archaeon]